jgi:hypothetical protein
VRAPGLPARWAGLPRRDALQARRGAAATGRRDGGGGARPPGMRLGLPSPHAAEAAGERLVDLGLLEAAEEPGIRLRWSELYRVVRARPLRRSRAPAWIWTCRRRMPLAGWWPPAGGPYSRLRQVAAGTPAPRCHDVALGRPGPVLPQPGDQAGYPAGGIVRASSWAGEALSKPVEVCARRRLQAGFHIDRSSHAKRGTIHDGLLRSCPGRNRWTPSRFGA